MTSLFANFDLKRTTLVFPTSQNLWTFFAMAEIKDFRIESSKCVFSGKLQRSDIEFAKRRFGANELCN